MPETVNLSLWVGRGRWPSRCVRGSRVLSGSRCHVGRVTSRGETTWCTYFTLQLAEREARVEQEKTEEREGWVIGRPVSGFRGVSWTAVASEARRRFANGEPRTEGPIPPVTAPRNTRGSGKTHARMQRRQGTNKLRTIAASGEPWITMATHT
jgi:hypothetical protein